MEYDDTSQQEHLRVAVHAVCSLVSQPAGPSSRRSTLATCRRKPKQAKTK
jgi:hypothetical protein